MMQLDSTLVALIGIVALLHMGTITWKDVSGNTNAVNSSINFFIIVTLVLTSFF
jgi:hypothetical protein